MDASLGIPAQTLTTSTGLRADWLDQLELDPRFLPPSTACAPLLAPGYHLQASAAPSLPPIIALQAPDANHHQQTTNAITSRTVCIYSTRQAQHRPRLMATKSVNLPFVDPRGSPALRTSFPIGQAGSLRTRVGCYRKSQREPGSHQPSGLIAAATALL